MLQYHCVRVSWSSFQSSVCTTDGDGRLTGGDAVEFFKRSGLPRDQLAKVWAMADSSRRGFLDQASFAKVRGNEPLGHVHRDTLPQPSHMMAS